VTSGDDTVTITVADDGPGIPEKERAVLAQGRETPFDHTSGLGLWLVTWIVGDSGGEIDFETDDQWGSIVRLTLTRGDPAPASADTEEDSSTGQEAGSNAGTE